MTFDTTTLVLVVAAVLILAFVVWLALRARHSRRLRRDFGSEYDRTVESAGSRTAAERDLEERRKRVGELDLHDLPPARRGELRESWRQVELDFVDHPAAAVAAAHDLVRTALRERGYPLETVEQHPEDLAVEHGPVMEDYRRGLEIHARSQRGEAGTEDLRQALQHTRKLFQRVVGDGSSDQPEVA